MKKEIIILIAIVICVTGCYVKETLNFHAGNLPTSKITTSTASQAILKETNRILLNMEEKEGFTAYYNKRFICEDKAVYICNCSGFVGYVLENATKEHYNAIPFDSERYKYPRAVDYYEFFHNLPDDKPKDGWIRIENILRAEPGDIIAYKDEDEKPGSTGHVMIIYSKHRQSTVDTNTYWVYVVDATSKAHNDDTRNTDEDNVSCSNGVGKGIIWFSKDNNYYYWSNPRYRKQYEKIAIGRAVPFTKERLRAE